MADRPAKNSEAGAETISCPCCRWAWTVDQTTQKAILAELRGWDRRFDRPETILGAILECLADNPLGPSRERSEKV